MTDRLILTARQHVWHYSMSWAKGIMFILVYIFCIVVKSFCELSYWIILKQIYLSDRWYPYGYYHFAPEWTGCNGNESLLHTPRSPELEAL